MAARYRVRVTEAAADQIRQAAAWWRENRSLTPDAIAEDLEAAFDLISLQPGIGAAARNRRLLGIRRVLLGRIRYHLYYRVSRDDEAIEVVAFWHSSRGGSPTP